MSIKEESPLLEPDFLRALLDAREERWQRRLTLAELGTVLTLTLNLPGPDKRLPRWMEFHSATRKDVLRELDSAGFAINSTVSIVGAAGPEDHFLFRPSSLSEARALKRLAVAFEEDREENHRGRRLVDLDVMAPGGEAVERIFFGLPPRRCLCCSRPAKECAALVRHSLDEVLAAAERLLELERLQNSGF
ncbi:MAG: citrate lyase holo-[acyl-carrier protein] synthase [Synergistaceae bacterium]|nr:citrate lyase holo-[acyl-carrier protein] synthase [Synergistaceae bacterium]